MNKKWELNFTPSLCIKVKDTDKSCICPLCKGKGKLSVAQLFRIKIEDYFLKGYKSKLSISNRGVTSENLKKSFSICLLYLITIL